MLLDSESNTENTVYVVEVKCNNCSKSLFHLVPLGIEVNEHLKEEVCKFCNCKLIRQEINPYSRQQHQQ